MREMKISALGWREKKMISNIAPWKNTERSEIRR